MRLWIWIPFMALLALITSAHAANHAQTFAMTSSGFSDQGTLPVLYTCDGKNISPKLTWTNPPQNTKAFALVMSDPTAPHGTYYHWAIFNMPAEAAELDENVGRNLKGSKLGLNDKNHAAYDGPCPPKGAAHTYIFTLYALKHPITAKDGAPIRSILSEIQAEQIDSTTITAIYSRWSQ